MGARWDEDAAHGVVGVDDFGGFVVHVGFPIGVVFIVEKKDEGAELFGLVSFTQPQPRKSRSE
jgi:hypothetical protein